VFPSDGAFEWVRWLMFLNPLTYALKVFRLLLYGSDGWAADSLTAVSITLLFGTLLFAISLIQVRRGIVLESRT
jgi:ABC-type polysaccharide/polyol phosphate export permease